MLRFLYPPSLFSATQSTCTVSKRTYQATRKLHSDVVAPDQSLHLYIDSAAPSAQNLQRANVFFNSSSTSFNYSHPSVGAFPRDSPDPEIVFLGRSNVGKSSLLNTLLSPSSPARQKRGQSPGFHRGGAHGGSGTKIQQRRAGLSFTSATAGHTKLLSSFSLTSYLPPAAAAAAAAAADGSAAKKTTISVIDTPGYGPAARAEWGNMVSSYLRQRRQLRRAYVLVDALHGVKDSDRLLLDYLKDTGVSYQILLVKIDRIIFNSAGKLAADWEARGQKVKDSMEALIQESGTGGLADVLAVSAKYAWDGTEKGERIGISALRWSILVATGIV
jgi:GTP-binding protein